LTGILHSSFQLLRSHYKHAAIQCPILTNSPLYQIAFGTGTVILKLKRSSANAAGGSPMADRPTVERIKSAIRLGFRHLDTAEMYETEHETGVAIKESIAEGIVKREELFVTTKISSNFIEVRSAIDVSLEKLGLDYVDL